MAKPLKAEKADEWTELFNRMDPGWMGADGIYSIPLNGQDSKIGSANKDTITFFTFCDTFLGSVDPDTLRFNEFKFAHNSAAILTGSEPVADNIKFIYGKNGSMSYNSDNFGNSLYGYNVWPQDCIVVDNTLHILGFRVDNSMIPIGVDEIRVPIVNGMPDFNNFTVHKDLPLFYKGKKYEIYFGGAILDNTIEAGASYPDGYVYIYGIKTNMSFRLDKQLVVARVLKKDFGNVDEWRFFDGKDWKEGVASVDIDRASIADRASSEFSITPIDEGIYKGKYIFVFSHNSIEYRIGDSPFGPFGDEIEAYEIPEPDIYKDAVVYNAKAHPHLSKPGELLISYNVNKNGSFPSTNEIYRPRFITLKLNEYAGSKPVSKAKINVALGKPVVASDGTDMAGKAVDGQIIPYEHWYGKSDEDQWLMVDLCGEYTLSRWVVKHASAGSGLTAYNTRAYKLQKSFDGINWTDVDSVEYNTAPFTDRTTEPFDARYVRLYVTKPTQSENKYVRIYEFEVYGEEKKPDSTTAEGKPDNTTGDEEPDNTTAEEKPDNGTVTDHEDTVTQTGDRSRIGIAFILILLAALMIILLIRFRRINSY